jgi:hypothetical protein
MRVFQIIDSETHFIAAPDEAAARTFFVASMLEGLDVDVPEDLLVKEIAPEKWAAIGVRDEDAPGGRTTVAALMHDDIANTPFLLCSTVY